MDFAYALAVLKIIAIDVALSADNAVVIAMAAHRLPPKQQRVAMLCGAGGAIVLRIFFTALVARLLDVALLRLAGGVMLVWIAAKLLLAEEGDDHVKAADGLMQAVWTIILADFAMSLDNMLAVGGASEGHLKLLVMGLLASIAIIMTCSTLIAAMMNRYPWLVTLGAGVLAVTAGEMILQDHWLMGAALRHGVPCLTSSWHALAGDAGAHAHWAGRCFIALVTAGVIAAPRLRSRLSVAVQP